MAEPAVQPHVSYADYLDMEEKSATKHEWLDGVVYDMSGGTLDHSRIAVNLSGIIRAQLAGKRCAVFNSDLKIRVLATGLGTYPDVSVICGRAEPDPESRGLAVTNPTVLVEVLSDSTEAYDRGEKFAHYRRIPSLREYVLVSQSSPFIEVFRKNEAGQWVLVAEARAGETVTLESIGCSLPVDATYENPLAEPEIGTSAR
jgi:Uma2 family endonuclease